MSRAADVGGRIVLAGASLAWGATTSAARLRRLNEDALLASPPIFAVADGMGGHDAGEVASALAVERLRALSTRGDVTMEGVAAELQEVNGLLRDASPDPRAAMGTTGVGMVLLVGASTPSWLVFNVGDSRAYCLDGDGLHQISRDHSYVQELVEAGEVPPEAAGRHPHRHVITRALGVDRSVEVDYWVRPVRPGERFLLCSDGLSGEIDDDEIRAVLCGAGPPGETASALVARAIDAGGHDDATAVVVDVVSVAGWDDAATVARPADRRAGSAPPAEIDIDTVDRSTRQPDDPSPGDPPDERTVPRPPPPAPPPDGWTVVAERRPGERAR